MYIIASNAKIFTYSISKENLNLAPSNMLTFDNKLQRCQVLLTKLDFLKLLSPLICQNSLLYYYVLGSSDYNVSSIINF